MDALSGLRRRWKRSGLEAFARRHERALLLAVLCLSVMAPLVKYMALSDHWDSSIEIHRASASLPGGTSATEKSSSLSGPAGALLASASCYHCTSRSSRPFAPSA